jgi:hypothetical protein
MTSRTVAAAEPRARVRAVTDPRILEVELCGARVAARLASIGIERLEQLRGRDPEDVVHAVNVQAGRVIWTGVMPIRAMTNLIAAAERTVPL